MMRPTGAHPMPPSLQPLEPRRLSAHTPAPPDLTGDVLLLTLGRHGAITSQNANALLQGGTRTIDLPLDFNNVGQLATTDAHYPVDNFVTFRRGVGTLQTAQELAGGA